MVATEKCDNYDICEKYAIYGICEHVSKGQFDITNFCDVHQKQVINILANIDANLSKLLEKTSK